MSARTVEIGIMVRAYAGESTPSVPLRITGRPVLICGAVPGVLHKLPGCGYWQVTEPRSGLSMRGMREPKTQREAIRVAEMLVSSRGIDWVADAIERACEAAP